MTGTSKHDPGAAETGTQGLTPAMARAIARSAARRIDICRLDLTGRVVVTEAATGAYGVTAAAAAAVGARVHAITADSRHGSAASASADVRAIASSLDVDPLSIAITTDRNELPIEKVDVITNSGFVRPLDDELITRLPSQAAIALMYEAWEARSSDIDYGTAAARGIAVVGVDEHHPACDAFRFVGDLAMYGIRRRSWPVRDSRITVLSDNLFAQPIADAIRANGGHVTAGGIDVAGSNPADIVVVAMTPGASAAGAADPADIAAAITASGAYGCVQVWGDIDRAKLASTDVAIEPTDEPPPGHQGVSMNAAGFEAVVRLQVAGLAAVQHRDAPETSPLHGLAQTLSAEEPG